MTAFFESAFHGTSAVVKIDHENLHTKIYESPGAVCREGSKRVKDSSEAYFGTQSTLACFIC